MIITRNHWKLESANKRGLQEASAVGWKPTTHIDKRTRTGTVSRAQCWFQSLGQGVTNSETSNHFDMATLPMAATQLPADENIL